MRAIVAALLFAWLAGGAAAPPPRGADPADEAVCSRLAAQAPEQFARGLVRSASLDIDGDGTPERLVINNEGTAHVDSYEVARADGQSIAVEATDAGFGDGAFFDGSQAWLVEGGKAYVLSFAGRDPTYLAYVLRITPDFKERPVCRFAPQTRVNLAAVSAPQSFCDAVAARKVAAVRVSPFPPQKDFRFDPPGGAASLVGQVRVDAANSGARTTLYQARIESGAGAGCTLSYFDIREGESAQRRALLALQHIEAGAAYPRGGCRDAPTRWLVWRGRTYLDTRSTEAEAPSSDSYEYREVAWLQGGRPHIACRARYEHLPPRLSAWWTGSAWSATP